MPAFTVSVEVHAEPEEGYSYGTLVDRALAGGAVAAGVDLRTPSSASSPTLTYEVMDVTAAHQVAVAFGFATAEALYADRDAVVVPHH